MRGVTGNFPGRAELIGVDGVAGDAEVLTLLLECLSQVGLSSFKVAVGHVGFLRRCWSVWPFAGGPEACGTGRCAERHAAA